MLGSPQVYRERNFVFNMFFNEGNEPPHVHVFRAGCKAKFWLSPVEEVWSHGFNSAELHWIVEQLRNHHNLFMERWNDLKARQR